MASIPYQAKDCHFSQDKGTGDPPPELVSKFYTEAKRQIVTGDYLRRKWQPRCGTRFYGLIKALRGHCSYDIKAGEAMCYPSEETLARECGVTRRTILNWLKREQGCKAACGSCERCRRKGQFCHPRHGDALQKFLRIKGELRYDPVGKRAVKTSNRYFIRMDDPPIPEDEPLIWAKARELAVEYLEHQAEEQDRDARRQEFQARAVRAAASGDEGFTYNNVKKMPAQQWEKRTQDRLFSTPQLNTDSHRSEPREMNAAQAIRNTKKQATNQANRTKDEEDEARTASTTISHIASAQHPEDLFRHAAPSDEEEERRREERETALAAASEAAGGVIYSLLEELGDAHAASGTRNVLSFLVAAGAPPVQMPDLAYLARDRVRAFVLRGGHILNTPVGFYITTLCNLAQEARRKGWKLDKIAAADRRRHERAIRQGVQRVAGQATPQESARPACRTTRRPTPEEAEALVMELGQQEDTYTQAQAQVRQQREAREEREARQQAVQLQARLFSQLAQAEQALKMHPEGSLAWERAQREKQELERQIAALRQQAGPAGDTA